MRAPIEHPVSGDDDWGVRIWRTGDDDDSVTMSTADATVDTTCRQADTALCHTGWLGSDTTEMER